MPADSCWRGGGFFRGRHAGKGKCQGLGLFMTQLMVNVRGCTPIQTWAPYGKSLYKPYIVGILGYIYNPQESLENTQIPWVHN